MSGRRGPEARSRCSVILGVWLVVSVVAGTWMGTVDWGHPERFHGTGVPFATVYWDRDKTTGRFIDFPSPHAFVLNPLAVFLAGVLPFLVVRGLTGKWRRRGARSSSRYSG